MGQQSLPVKGVMLWTGHSPASFPTGTGSSIKDLGCQELKHLGIPRQLAASSLLPQGMLTGSGGTFRPLHIPSDSHHSREIVLNSQSNSHFSGNEDRGYDFEDFPNGGEAVQH